MAILIPLLLLFVILIVLATLTQQKKHPFWGVFTTASALLLGLGVLWSIRSPRPWRLDLSFAQDFTPTPYQLSWIGDFVSWTFVSLLNMGLLTSLLLSLSAIRVEVMRRHPRLLMHTVALVFFSSMVVLSANLFTFVCCLAAYDGFLLISSIWRQKPTSPGTGIQAGAWRMISIWLMLWATLNNSLAPLENEWVSLSTSSMIALWVGLSLRLVRFDFPGEPPQNTPLHAWRTSIFTMTELCAIWSLAVRLTTHLGSLPQRNFWLLVFGCIASVASLQWMLATQESKALRSFFVASSVLFLGAMLYTEPIPLLIAMNGSLLGMVMLANLRQGGRALLFVRIIQWLIFGFLMLTLPWSHAEANQAMSLLYKALWIISMSLFIVGQWRHSLHLIKTEEPLERWMWVTNFLGIGLILSGTLIPAYWRFFILAPITRQTYPLSEWWPSIVAVLLVPLLYWISVKILPMPSLHFETRTGTWTKAYRVIIDIMRTSTKTAYQLLEKQGGIIWTILFVALLIALAR